MFENRNKFFSACIYGLSAAVVFFIVIASLMAWKTGLESAIYFIAQHPFKVLISMAPFSFIVASVQYFKTGRKK